MAQSRGHRFTIYDALEAAGLFDSNPANTFARNSVDGSSLYSGPQPYPKMLYHPDGEERIVVPAEEIMTPHGPKYVGEQRELIWQIVPGKKEHQVLVAEGWHDHPAKAIRARVEGFIAGNEQISEKEKKRLLASIPMVSQTDRIQRLEAELARLLELQKKEEEEEVADAAPVSAPGIRLANGLTIQPTT